MHLVLPLCDNIIFPQRCLQTTKIHQLRKIRDFQFRSNVDLDNSDRAEVPIYGSVNIVQCFGARIQEEGRRDRSHADLGRTHDFIAKIKCVEEPWE